MARVRLVCRACGQIVSYHPPADDDILITVTCLACQRRENDAQRPPG